MAYNEFKFLVTNEKLAYVKNLLDGLYSQSDAYPEGVVDTIYYDSQKRNCYRQCIDGESQKSKFRIRGYLSGHYTQVHLKLKDIFSVSKLKAPISLSVKGVNVPQWDEVCQLAEDNSSLSGILATSNQFGPLKPVIRIRYYRYRYRIYDYRMTLDTCIEAQNLSLDGWDQNEKYGILPCHTLEIKTVDPLPVLPFMGLIQLPQVSFSKFFLGCQLLDSRAT